MKSSKSVNKNSAVTWRYLPKKFILPAIIVLISAMFYYFSSGFNTVAGIAQLNEINSVDKDVKQSGISDVAIIEANEKETLKEIQTDQLNETKSLIYLSRPSWRLKGSLSDHFDRLKSQYEEGDVNAAYILSKNLRYCWYIPSNQQCYEKALDLANENGESDRFMNRLTEKYKQKNINSVTVLTKNNVVFFINTLKLRHQRAMFLLKKLLPILRQYFS